MKKTAVTFGDPNGISFEITVKALNFLDLPSDEIVLITNSDILEYYKDNFGLSLEKNYKIIDVPFDINKLRIGKETETGGEFSFCSLVKACNLAEEGLIDSIVTAPVSKNAMKTAGHNYSGQTEVLEQYLANKEQKAEMIFVCDKFSVMLMTRHIAINKISEYIKKDLLIARLEKLAHSLKMQLNIKSPSIAVCALNPHAGENGMFGREEIDEIIPAINELRKKGINIEGPFPADSLFTKCAMEECKYDCYIAMYHDQGLIPVKLLERDNCVNTTLGLNILRTSPAHGTAYDIAGKNIANPSSMINAIKLAVK